MMAHKWVAVMTGLIAFVLSIHDVIAQETACQTVAGNWTDPTSGSWAVDQGTIKATTGAYPLSGQLNTSGACTGGVYAVSGGFSSSSGAFTLTATWPTTIASRPSSCPATILYNGTVLQPGCDVASGSWQVSGSGGSFRMTKACDVPNGETTPVFDEWEPGDATTAIFKQQPTPSSFNYGGRTFEQTFPTSGVDTCWYLGSPVDEHTVGPPASTEVANDGTYVDRVGPGVTALVTYREHNKTPCGWTVHQTMSIACSTGNQVYVNNNILSAFISDTNVTDGRADSALATVKLGAPPSRDFVEIVLNTLFRRAQ
jgi:hypothetical protein